MAADTGLLNTSPDYSKSQNFSFTPSASSIPGQRTSYDAFNKDFTGFLGSQETVPQLQDRYSNKYNIPFLQGQAQEQNNRTSVLGSQIAGLPGSVNSSTMNSMLTQGQKDRVLESRQAPLMQQYNQSATQAGQTNSALGTAETNINQAVSAEQAQQMKMTQPWLQKYDEMTISNAAENSQWSQTNQMELDNLLANQRAGISLSEGQQGRLEQLASQENAFQNSLAYYDKQNNAGTLQHYSPSANLGLWGS